MQVEKRSKSGCLNLPWINKNGPVHSFERPTTSTDCVCNKRDYRRGIGSSSQEFAWTSYARSYYSVEAFSWNFCHSTQVGCRQLEPETNCLWNVREPIFFLQFLLPYSLQYNIIIVNFICWLSDLLQKKENRERGSSDSEKEEEGLSEACSYVAGLLGSPTYCNVSALCVVGLSLNLSHHGGGSYCSSTFPRVHHSWFTSLSHFCSFAPSHQTEHRIGTCLTFIRNTILDKTYTSTNISMPCHSSQTIDWYTDSQKWLKLEAAVGKKADKSGGLPMHPKLSGHDKS